MNHLLWPSLILAALSFFAGDRLARLTLPRAGQAALYILSGLLALPAVLYAAYYLHGLLDHAAWFFNLRTLTLTELLAGGSGFGAGLLQAELIKRLPRSSLIAASLLPVLTAALILVPYSKMIFSPLEAKFLQNRWRDGVCLQSTASTCGPCSVATLLKRKGIELTETEVAQAAYSSSRGTEVWYLARIMQAHGLQTEFVFDPPQQMPLRYPAIAGVRLDNPAGIGHFITILNQIGADYEIADPLLGKLKLSIEQLTEKYYFTGFYLVFKG